MRRKSYCHKVVTVTVKPLGIRIAKGTTLVDAVKGEAERLGIQVGDELLKVGDTLINSSTWKDYYIVSTKANLFEAFFKSLTPTPRKLFSP
mmetsp:Transcript_15790/g.25007  ORF Transcript_15790/g.25007 Transcript_15790/m.25007 type:complete len:91 (-) Transcript_15790:3234-3506(-)